MISKTGIDWDAWNLGDDATDDASYEGITNAMNRVQIAAAETVVSQIYADLKEEKAAISYYGEGDVKITFQLMEDTDLWVFFKVDDLDIYTDHFGDAHVTEDLDTIIEALKRLIGSCEEMRKTSVSRSKGAPVTTPPKD